jgi:hypothetical protein
MDPQEVRIKALEAAFAILWVRASPGWTEGQAGLWADANGIAQADLEQFR